MEVSAAQVVVGLVLLVRLAEFWLSRRNAERRLAAGAEEIAGDLHLAMAMFHALWLAVVAVLAERATQVDTTWLGAGLLLLALRGYRIFRAPPGWSIRLFRDDSPKPEPVRHLLRDACYLPMFAELLVLPLIFGLWWFAVIGSAIYAVLAWQRLAAEGLR